MPWSSYALDTFIAPKLSRLTVCSAKELAETESLLSAFLLNSILVVRLRDPLHRYAFNLIRRVDQASYDYSQGRDHLVRYIQEKSRDVITPYFRALSHFEQCLATVAQAVSFAERLLGTSLSKPGDKSALERLKALYNASKHMDARIASGAFPEKAGTEVWIVNEGLECDNAALTFDELHELLVELQKLARQVAIELPKQRQDRAKDKDVKSTG
jgi:hypothetical protein